MKRGISLVLALALVVVSSLNLTGCSTKKVAVMTKGQWIQKLADNLQLTECVSQEAVFRDVKSDSVYFTPVQACAEWDILDKEEAFDPDSNATVDFAISTAVRAIGVDKIAKSTYQKTLQTDDDRIEFFREISNQKYISGGALYAEWGDNVLSDMNTIMSELQLQQYQDIGYTENCIEVSAEDVEFSLDGKTGAILNDSISIQPGTILVIMPSEVYPEGMSVKVVKVSGNKFTYTNAAIEEVIDHLTVTGTYQPKVLGVLPMSDNVKVKTINGDTAVQQAYYQGAGQAQQLMYVPEASAGKLKTEAALQDIEFELLDISGSSKFEDSKSKTKGKMEGSAKATVGIRDILVTADIQMEKFISVKKAYARIDSTLYANLSASGSCSETIPLAMVPCQIFAGVTVEFQASLVIGANGEMEIDWSLPTSVGVEYTKGASPKFIQNQKKANLKMDAHVEVYALPGIKGVFKVFGFSVASAGVSSGVKLQIDGTAETKGKFYCVNMKEYVPLTCFVGGEGEETLLGKLGAKKSWTIWDKENSIIQINLHIENNEIVPKCTHPEEEEVEAMELEEYKLPEFPKTDIPDFEMFESGYFGLDRSFYAMKENTSEKLSLDRLPNGYKKEDLVFESDNEAVATIGTNGEITATGTGTATIKVSTKDGKYSQYCAICVISNNYTVEYEPLKPVSPMLANRQNPSISFGIAC